MSRRLSKQQAIALFATAKGLATALGISKSAVSQWSEGPIPEIHDLKIRYELRPEHFRCPDAPGLPPTPARKAGTASGP
jgi:DNA-binding transcriptional regulator YdaS (Cro superfamily)